MNVKKINETLPKEQRLGQIGISNNGEKMTIIAYRKSEDIDIQFEDGIITKHKRYEHFLKGLIKHPIKYEESFAFHIEVELGLDINKIWNFKKNTVNPHEIYKSGTKKVWLYCQEKDYHNDEGGYEITCNNFYNGNRCSYCSRKKVHKLDSLAHLYPQISEMIVTDKRNDITMEDLYKVATGSHNKYYFKCNECGKNSSRKKILSSIVRKGYSCEHCSDGISTPEKFMINILKQLNIEFVTQLTKTTFKWCGNYRYDFYIPSLNMIIETHGEQHYIRKSKNSKWNSLERVQENDRLKKKLALKNNIDNYIIVDCRKSEFDWLKENINKELGNYFDLLDVDWELAWEKSKKRLFIEIKELLEKGYSDKEIINELHICKDTLKKYKNF